MVLWKLKHMGFTQYFIKSRLRLTLTICLLFYAIWYISKHVINAHAYLSALDPVIGFATFIIAIVLWGESTYRDYYESIEKRITIQFDFDGRPLLICENAILHNINDARAWAQQVGAQMCGGSRNLKFEPFYDLQDQGIVSTEGKKYRFFKITFKFLEFPVLENRTDEEKAKFQNNLKKGSLIWTLTDNTKRASQVTASWRANQVNP
jgi:hypothetical protein